ncbi:probable disease resistance protein At5g66900 [Telopea speciosissima]|uniref:probable disease resistance protein At5g66900 n=1 Tax=Telopea speciosissima TaxID=54955 RepID=UPI001CC3CE3A|nr:probable disease resistance protein At5g66900 [Telopea speciosissima]
MSGQLPVGFLLGPPAQELQRVISDVILKAHHFKHYLEQLQSTLKTITPRIKEIDRLSAELTDHQRQDIVRLKAELVKGQKLVKKCSSVPSWNCFKRCRRSKKILKLDKTLLQFFQIDVPVDIWLHNKQILVDLRDMITKFDTLSLRSESSRSDNSGPQIRDKVFGLDVPLMELKMQLFREDVMVLGLCAPGGCGKTTLATMLCRDSDVRDRFKSICFLSISSSPNFKAIVQRLSEQMFPNDPVPQFLSDEEAYMKLGNLLMLREQQPILLVLDDVWEDSVVEKFIFRTGGYKIFVTSRTECQAFDCKYSLKMLSDADAMTLFYHSAFPGNGNNGNYEEPDRDLQNKIVRGCRGLPLALKVIGNSLRQQPVEVWKNTERMLTNCSIFESHSDLLSCLASSLDYLNKKAQECFMDLGSFPEDERIPASTLIDIWVELYDLDEVDAYINLLELSTRNLVNLIEITSGDACQIDGNLNGLFVTQHDLLRDLAIYRSRQQGTRLIMERREDSIPKGWSEKGHQFQNARLVSIYTGEMFKSNWCNMHFPEVEVLILNFSATKYILPPLMERIDKLKVLIIVNHGRYCAQLSCMITPGYLSNIKRVRLEKVLVPSLNEITMPLKNLRKISLFMCEVDQALRSCNFNFPYMLPNLVEINIDSCKDLVELPNGLCDLVHLKKLSITNCHELLALPQGIGCMRDLEVLRLNACTGLVELPNSIQKLQKLRFLDIADCLNMERLPEGMGEFHGLEKLDMRQCLGLRELPNSVMNLMDLKEVICDDETANLWEPLQQDLSKLKITVPKDINLSWLGVDL